MNSLRSQWFKFFNKNMKVEKYYILENRAVSVSKLILRRPKLLIGTYFDESKNDF